MTTDEAVKRVRQIVEQCDDLYCEQEPVKYPVDRDDVEACRALQAALAASEAARERAERERDAAIIACHMWRNRQSLPDAEIVPALASMIGMPQADVERIIHGRAATLAASGAAREREKKVNAVLGIEARAAYSHIHLILMDLARRIGIASRPEWVRDEIEKEANKYATWARAKSAALDAPATGEVKSA
jgi:hypothetical protein